MDTHRFDVGELSKEIRSFHERKRAFRIYHGGTHSSRAMHDPRGVIHTGHLHHILDINASSCFAMVEPNVSMEKLVKETLKHGMVPPVVPSFPGTTVGGNFSGTAGSSSSFRNGFFDRAVLWVEVILPDGTIARASRTRNSELLDGMVGSLGTLGVATLFQIKLVPASKWVDLTYLPVQSAREVLEAIDEASQDFKNDFVEALIFGPKAQSYGVVTLGRFSAASYHPQVLFSSPSNDWFYEHALHAGETTESVPITDYLFRHDRGSFSLGQCCFGRLPLNNWTRWSSETALKSAALAETMQALHWTDHLFVQDLVVPQDTTAAMLEYLESDLKIYPLLLYPVRQWPDEKAVMRLNPTQTPSSINISFRGYTPSTINNPAAFIEKHRQLERLVHHLGGYKWLYSRNYYTEEDFWETYPREQYEQLREKYHAEYLQSVWKKSEAPERRGVAPKPKGFWDRVFAKSGVVAVRGGQERGERAEEARMF